MNSERRPWAMWRKSSRSGSGGGQCVEIADLRGLIGIRDSKAPQGPVLEVRSSAFQRLVKEIRYGRYDI